jgi:hypothetical protein
LRQGDLRQEVPSSSSRSRAGMLGSSQWFVIHAHTLPTTIGACRSVHQAKHSESQFVRSRGRDGSAERRTRVPLVDVDVDSS